jgi:hypothetical protein
MTEFIVLVALMLGVGFIGSKTGEENGKIALCAEQFKGEMHNGKCVTVTRETVK